LVALVGSYRPGIIAIAIAALGRQPAESQCKNVAQPQMSCDASRTTAQETNSIRTTILALSTAAHH
jgi:hypothetical protein